MTLDFIFKTCTGKTTEQLSDNGQLDWYDAYADGRDAGKGILAANWNHFPRLTAGSYERTPEQQTAQDFNWGRGRKFQAILERLGYQLEWADTVSRCGDCGGCIQTEPDCYGWTPEFHVFDGDILCQKCILNSPESYLGDVEDNPRTAVHNWINPADHGYTLVKTDLENGFHPGQNDNPTAIFRELRDRGYDGILFQIDSTGQFDTRFSVYAREIPADQEQE